MTAIASVNNPSGTTNTTFLFSVEATGGTPPYTYLWNSASAGWTPQGDLTASSVLAKFSTAGLKIVQVLVQDSGNQQGIAQAMTTVVGTPGNPVPPPPPPPTPPPPPPPTPPPPPPPTPPPPAGPPIEEFSVADGVDPVILGLPKKDDDVLELRPWRKE